MRPAIRFLSIGLLFCFSSVVAQTEEPELKKPEDSTRECNNAQEFRKAGADELILPAVSWGNNPQEGEYRREIERLMKLEIQNVNGAILDVVGKHKELIKLYPQLKLYQEIILEDNPGAWREGVFVNSKKVLSLHYSESGDLDCLVLDSMIRGVDRYEHWTRKIMRLYYPSIQTLQLETRTHNLKMLESLENTSPEVQLKALRFVFQNLRTALYSMDMLIAAYYDRRNKRNEWQINL